MVLHKYICYVCDYHIHSMVIISSFYCLAYMFQIYMLHKVCNVPITCVALTRIVHVQWLTAGNVVEMYVWI